MTRWIIERVGEGIPCDVVAGVCAATFVGRSSRIKKSIDFIIIIIAIIIIVPIAIITIIIIITIITSITIIVLLFTFDVDVPRLLFDST